MGGMVTLYRVTMASEGNLPAFSWSRNGKA